MNEFLAFLPPHKAGLHLSHNPHRDIYASVETYTTEDDGSSEFVSEDERTQAIANDELWELHWYPETPVGFHRRFASTLLALLAGVQVFRAG